MVKYIFKVYNDLNFVSLVSIRLKEHIQEGTNNPILIFPEGGCSTLWSIN